MQSPGVFLAGSFVLNKGLNVYVCDATGVFEYRYSRWQNIRCSKFYSLQYKKGKYKCSL